MKNKIRFSNDLLHKYKRYIFISLFLLSLFDIAYSSTLSDVLFFILLLLWISCIFVFKLGSYMTFKLVIFFLISLFPVYIFDSQSILLDRISFFIYFLLLIGIIQHFFELKGVKNES